MGARPIKRSGKRESVNFVNVTGAIVDVSVKWYSKGISDFLISGFCIIGRDPVKD
jgi:hypothetical protein